MERRHKDEKESMDEEQESGSLKFINRRESVDNDNESTDDSDSDDDSVKDTENNTEEEEEEEHEPRVDVWQRIVKKSVKHGRNILDTYRDEVIFCRSFDDDTTHAEVIRTLEKVQEDEGMDFEEALEYAVDKRKFLIMRELNKFDEEELQEMRETTSM